MIFNEIILGNPNKTISHFKITAAVSVGDKKFENIYFDVYANTVEEIKTLIGKYIDTEYQHIYDKYLIDKYCNL